jgi:hypothetical protein
MLQAPAEPAATAAHVTPPTDDDLNWAARCIYWLENRDPKSRPRKKNRPERQPLILSGHGMRLRIDHGTLLVQNGFTHYPQRREEFRLFPGDWRASAGTLPNVPSRPNMRIGTPKADIAFFTAMSRVLIL